MAQARPVSSDEQDALQLLRITSEISQQDLPALQGMAASALSIIGVVANFKSNKKEWKAFGRFVQDAATRVVLSLVDHEETREAMEVRMERVFRAKTFRQDPRKISALENQISNAVEGFLVRTLVVRFKSKFTIASHIPRTYNEVDPIAASTMARYEERLTWWLAPNTVVASSQMPSASSSNQIAPSAQSLVGNTINVAGNSYGLNEEQLALKSALERLRYAPGASWNPALACLPGTRLAVLSAVDDWSRSTGPQRVFLLKAVAGSGKSAIAHSIAQMFHANGHLASSFFFSRNIIYRDTPQYLFTTIARDIASRHPAFAADVGRTLEHEPALASAPLSRQFKDLISDLSGRSSGVTRRSIFPVELMSMPGVMDAFWQLLSSAIKSDGIEDNTDPLDFDAIARSLIDSAAAADAQSGEPEIDESAYLDNISPLLAPGLPNLSSSSTIPSTAVPPSQMVVWPPVRVSTGREGYGVDGQRRNARNAPGHVPGIAIDGSLTLLTPSQWVNIDSWSDWSDPGSMHTLLDIPIVVVIDALDEGISKDLELILSRDIGDLPADLRLFITSRPTRSIERCLGGKGYVKLHVIELDSDENQQDIATYVDVKLQEEIMSSKMGNAQLDEAVVRDLVAMSEGLFFWLAEAFDYLRSVSNPTQEIKLLVSTPGSQECCAITRATDALCATILDVCVGDDWHDEKFCRNYRHIIGVIVAATRPLSLVALRALHGNIQSPSLEALLEQFSGIIVVNAQDQERTVRILHKSFRGFIMGRAVNASETRKFHIVEKDAAEELAHICLRTMDLRRILAAEQVAEKSTELAASLHNLYSCLYRLGRQREALIAIQEAVSLYSAGAAERPVVFDAQLANSLHHLSIQLVNCEQPEEALKVEEEATMLRRALLDAEHEAALQSLDTVLNKIKRIADATAGMVATMAKHNEADSALLPFSKQMEGIYSFADDIDSDNLQKKIQPLKAVIIRALEQTIEYSIFFREYTPRGFTGRVVTQDVSIRDEIISELSLQLVQLQGDLESGGALRTAFLSSQTGPRVDRLAKPDVLRDLKPADMSAAERLPCLPGTRQERLKEIIEWLLTPSDKNVLWLHGEAGVGKSTIATTIAEYFGSLGRRGAFLLFDRNAPLESAPTRVISTLAFQLAQHNAAICSAVSIAIGQRPGIVSDPMSTQFQSCLVEPLAAAAIQIEGPIIVVLDALDECGDGRSRQILLELLAKDLTKLLPAQLRILITSRPEHDISCALASRSHVHTIDLSTASDADLQMYIKHEMRRIYKNRRIMDELPEGWGNAAIDILVGYAAGLFIWAATAMRLLSDADFPKKYLSELLRHDRPFFTLHELYEKALRSASSWEPGDTTNVYRGILGLIIISQVPLTEVTIAAMLGYQDDIGTCRTALRRLASVIRWSEGQPARTLHKSFPDYLTKHCSSEPWFINVEEHHYTLSNACLRIMNERLHFNMCSLTTSHIPNEQIVGLSGRVETAIPQTLSYSCLFWGYHIQKAATRAPSLLQMILAFFQEKFLYWLEVLSLMGEMRLVSQTMVAVRESIKVSKQCVLFADSCKPKLKFATNQNSGSEVDAFAQDGLAFSRRFGQAMTFSTPHIYISCIPFAPQQSAIKQQYMPHMRSILAIKSGMNDTWPVLQQAIEHPSAVLAVAFSPDGLRIASGSEDGLVRVWDAETGALIAASFEGHTEYVTSVAFSPDGQWIASGSRDNSVCVWNTETGALIAGPFAGHTKSVNSVAFSPDGQRIASGSSDKSVRIWNPQTGALIAGPFEGHTRKVYAVAFSPDGRRIVSGSDDRSVRVGDAETGSLVAGPFEGHTRTVYSVAFSPDGKLVASGARDESARVWNVETGVLSGAPFKGHTNRVFSVAFSPDGHRIASGSADQTVRVWDVKSGALIAGPFQGHTNWIHSVAFSPDGQRIASGSDDKSVRIWRAEAGVC
ncbi:hypothetical protein HWV62_36029 [Athelia sp. TMB]|nr:hypothetical protein HWV62_36029 [Athelia sp. TMB]